MRKINKELFEQIKRHEGLRLFPYRCSAGKLTIGYGRNLEDRGITKDEANRLLVNDITACVRQLNSHIAFYKDLNQKQQNILTNMCFNLGIYGLLKFKKFLAALEVRDLKVASREMLNSRWAMQVGYRAEELANQMINSE